MSRNNLTKTKIETASGYDLWSLHYDQKLSHTVRAARQALRQLTPELSGKSILEIGCGTGENLMSLSGSGVQNAIGIDFSAGMLTQAKAKQYDFPTDFILHDVQTPLPFAPSSVDVVLMSLVLEHLVDIDFTFGELSRVLVSGGQSVVIELHPFLALSGGFARFADGVDGIEYDMSSRAYSVSDILNAHLRNNLVPKRIAEVTDAGEEMPSVFGIHAQSVKSE